MDSARPLDEITKANYKGLSIREIWGKCKCVSSGLAACQANIPDMTGAEDYEKIIYNNIKHTEGKLTKDLMQVLCAVDKLWVEDLQGKVTALIAVASGGKDGSAWDADMPEDSSFEDYCLYSQDTLLHQDNGQQVVKMTDDLQQDQGLAVM